MNAENTIFVSLPHPNATLTPEAGLQQWKAAAIGITTDTTPTMNPEPETPTIEELFEKALPVHILTSRWGRYIGIGSDGLRPLDFIRDGATLVHHEPNENFWELYRQAKGIFKQLGFSVKRTTRDGYPLWIVNIPIATLNDTVFFESGLAHIEAEILRPTGIDPAKILNDIRTRQFQATQDAIRRGGA